MSDYVPLSSEEWRRLHAWYEPCCPDAVRVFCVCRISVKCPRHGVQCAGSHD